MPDHDIYVDPATQNVLQCKRKILTALSDKEIVAFPIVNEIPRFCGSGYAVNFGDQWNNFAEDQFDESDNEYKDLRRAEQTLQGPFPISLEEIKGKTILEAGAGNGRFTYVMLRKGAIVHSFDLSHAVEALRKNMIKRQLWETKALALAQADIRQMPYRNNFYDFVVCLHVLQHTPSPEMSVHKLWEKVKPGGALVFDHYRLKLKSLYPPLGGFGNLFRHFILFLPYKYQKPVCDAFVKFWFPVHWFFRNSSVTQAILMRLSPVRFYYPWLGLPSREAYFQKALLDTHDGSTDKYHHVRTKKQIERLIRNLPNVEKFEVREGGNGLLAWVQRAI